MQKWNFYTSKEVKPKGWMRRQLEIQAAGLSGNLDKVWPDVRDSAWIGGDREGWERVPYWLDGFIPLAYLLEDADLIARAGRYMDAILDAQCADGWICPCTEDKRTTYDTWAVQLISKVLVVYYECSGDKRIPDVLYRVLKNYYELLQSGTVSLFEWGKFRWFEGMIAIRFVYERCHEDWLLALAKILQEQGADYESFSADWERPINHWRFETHIVNLCMMLKSEAVSSDLLAQPYTDLAERLQQKLQKWNGTPVGLFTGDECLSGLSPIQGTELCAVVEQMYSYEWLYAVTGEAKWAERLELLAFNALPATISEDMWTHQYDQMSNQIACVTFPGRPLFRTNSADAHLFGLEPNYGCCTANLHQGWPKLALSAFLHRENEVHCALAIPAKLEAEGLSVELSTNYPFENRMVYRVQSEKPITFSIRVPSFAKNLTVDGAAAQGWVLSFEIAEGENREIVVAFDTEAQYVTRPHNLTAVQCGSLVFSLPVGFNTKMLEYERDGVPRRFPYCDYELYPTTDWNYGFCGGELVVERGEIGEYPFSVSKPPVTIRAKVQPIDWGFEDGFTTVCAKVPQSRAPIGEAVEIALQPYGCTKLRMTEMPIVK